MRMLIKRSEDKLDLPLKSKERSVLLRDDGEFGPFATCRCRSTCHHLEARHVAAEVQSMHRLRHLAAFAGTYVAQLHVANAVYTLSFHKIEYNGTLAL